MFDGIPEEKGEPDDSFYENIQDNLPALPHMNVNDIYIVDHHRLGHF